MGAGAGGGDSAWEVGLCLENKGVIPSARRNDGISFVLIEDDLFVLGTKRSKETSYARLFHEPCSSPDPWKQEQAALPVGLGSGGHGRLLLDGGPVISPVFP